MYKYFVTHGKNIVGDCILPNLLHACRGCCTCTNITSNDASLNDRTNSFESVWCMCVLAQRNSAGIHFGSLDKFDVYFFIQVTRDPRFDDLSGDYREELFSRSYGFLNDIKHREREVRDVLHKKRETTFKKQTMGVVALSCMNQ